jgi:hypothetical protein
LGRLEVSRGDLGLVPVASFSFVMGFAEGISIVANIMALLTFALDASTFGMSVYDAIQGVKNEEFKFAEHANTLKTMTESLQASIVQDANGALSSAQLDRELYSIAKDCSTTAEYLQDLFEKARKASIVGKLWQTFIKREDINDAHQQLLNHQRNLNTRILMDIRTQFEKLNNDLPGGLVKFLTELLKGNESLMELVAQESKKLQDHITSEVSTLGQKLTKKDAMAAFVDSFSFPELTLRQQQIQEPHKGSCSWIIENTQNQPDSFVGFTEWLRGDNKFYWICVSTPIHSIAILTGQKG